MFPTPLVRVSWLALGLLAQTLFADAYSPPPNYYAACSGLSGSVLDSALNARTRGQTVRTYDQLRQDLAVTDRDWAFPPPAENPAAITNILLVYSLGWSGYSRNGTWDGGATWNREHTWPDSRGVGQPDSGPDFSDLHHLRAANPSANTSRSNNWFDTGGTLGPVTQAPQARWTIDTWEPPDVDKGWIARACLYMATRYDGTETNTTDLVLVETPPSSTTGNPPQMGRLSTLLRWNRAFPPSEWERRRNQIVYERFQGNRNPFIDHPEFADAIYEKNAGRDTFFCWRLRCFTPEELDQPALADDLSDPDTDGCPNLLEYAFGGDPRAAGAGIEPRLQSTGAGLRLIYRRQVDRDLSLVRYAVEFADAPGGPWQTLQNAAETSAGVSATIETVSVALPASPGAARFWRVRVSH